MEIFVIILGESEIVKIMTQVDNKEIFIICLV